MKVCHSRKPLRPRQLYSFATWNFKARVVGTLQKACAGLSGLATSLMRAAAATPPPQPPRKRAHSLQSRSSPVAIDHQHLGDDPELQKRIALAVAALAFNFLHNEMVKHKLWNTLFEKGGVSTHGPVVRSLATRHLSSPAVDGWNAVAGAVELASAWAFDGAKLPRVLYGSHDLPYSVRIRLAVCMSVAWKFERQLASHFPRRFYDDKPSLSAPHTCELAYYGYAFMSDAERSRFGGWGEENANNVHALYDQMLAMELSLLLSVPVFSTLAGSNQVRAERCIQALLENAVLTVEDAMMTRSIVPFFNAVCQDGYTEWPTAGELVCAAILCVRVAADEDCEEDMCTYFTAFERKRAREFVLSALSLKDIPLLIVSMGCYADPSWINYRCISEHTLKRVLGVCSWYV